MLAQDNWPAVWNSLSISVVAHTRTTCASSLFSNQKCFIKHYAFTVGDTNLGHWCCLSVRGTYTTPMRAFLRKVPSLWRSYCSKTWLPPSGPTGSTSLPPGFSWSSNWGAQLSQHWAWALGVDRDEVLLLWTVKTNTWQVRVPSESMSQGGRGSWERHKLMTLSKQRTQYENENGCCTVAHDALWHSHLFWLWTPVELQFKQINNSRINLSPLHGSTSYLKLN